MTKLGKSLRPSGTILPTIANTWRYVTLNELPLPQWQATSWLCRLGIGSLRSWRQGSWLWQWADLWGTVAATMVFAASPFVSTNLTGIFLVACAGFFLLLSVTDEGKVALLTPIHLTLLVYWGIATVATAMSPVLDAAFDGWVKLTLYFLLFALLARLARSPRIRTWLITLYLHVALLISVYGLRQWFFKAEALATWTDPTSPTAGVTRVYSFLGNPNLLAGYLLPAVAFSMAAIFVWRGTAPKLLAVVMAACNSLCLVVTFSRGGWIGFLASGFVLVLLLTFWWSDRWGVFWRKWAMPAMLGSCFLLGALAVLLVEPVRDRFASIFAGREDSSNDFRLNVWAAVLDMIRDRPILGIGPGNRAFNLVYPRFMRPKFTALSAYSVLLETAVETGLIGLTAFLWFLIVTLSQGAAQLQQLRQQRDSQGYWLMAAIATLCGMMAHGLVDTVWYRPQVNVLWWLTVAIVASYYTVTRQPADSV